MNEILTELQKTKIEAFVKDKELFDAVEKVLLAGIYTHGTVKKDEPLSEPTINGAFSLVHLATSNPVTDEVLGQHLRGVWEGINALKNAFNRLKEVKATKVKVEDLISNEAI